MGRDLEVFRSVVIQRRKFLAAAGALGLSAPALRANAVERAGPFERALVLSGGGARGAYEAGAITGLAKQFGVRDFQPMPQYQLVCGSSIGALNGWFLATGQYSRLKDLWYGISAEKLIRLKAQFEALIDVQSGVLERATAAARLTELVRNQTGVLQNEPVLAWVARNVDPQAELLVPLIWAVTNLTTQRPEYFYMAATSGSEKSRQDLVDALRLTLGPNTVVREATADLVHRALFGSAAIPLAFDPVEIPGANGTDNDFVDGGVASNSPVAIAHAVARAADVILMDPPFQPEPAYEDAIAVAFGAFGTMQRKIIEVEMRNVYFQSIGARAFAELSSEGRLRATGGREEVARLMETVPATDLRFMRPEKTLPVGVGEFGNQEGVGAAFRSGWIDATMKGFKSYDWESFEL